MYLLDIDAISAVCRPDRVLRVVTWLREQTERELYPSAVMLGKIETGVYRREPRDLTFAADLWAWLDRSLRMFSDQLRAFGAEEARIWGLVTHDLGYAETDLMIAVVVTGNAADFAPPCVRVKNQF